MIVDPWHKLTEFETRDLISRHILKHFGREASKRQILEISSNFIQGREYFKNSQNASITVKPLLQYYGVMSLCRGLILTCQPALSEAQMKPSHGLSTINWVENITKGNFADLRVRIVEGTFYELLNATQNKSLFKHNSSGINWHFVYPLPKVGIEFSFSDLVKTLPTLSKEYEIWLEQEMPQLAITSFSPVKEQFQITIPERNQEHFIKSIFENIAITKLPSKNQTTLICPSNTPIQFSQNFIDAFNAGIGEVIITKLITNGLTLNSLAQFYCISFFMGMLARYFPSVWINLGRTEKGDSVFPLILKAIDSIDHYFPQLIYEFITKNENSIKTS